VPAAGAAAHTFPSTGGFGMNTGIQDAHNLAWSWPRYCAAAPPTRCSTTRMAAGT
jgi:2-polyprenyl-6-methoxyphenol hydroxylase-like FAD-dependent oxidoreductase